MQPSARNPDEETRGHSRHKTHSAEARRCRRVLSITRPRKLPEIADGQAFLDELTVFPLDSFEGRFSRRASRLNLGPVLRRAELVTLFEATFAAILCNIALNGRGGCRGVIKPAREFNRIRLEWKFMAVKRRFCATSGYQVLSETQKTLVHKHFLTVAVAAENLAP